MLAGATARAVGMMGIVTPVMKADAAAGALSEDEIMPLYELADIQNYNVSYGGGGTSLEKYDRQSG